MPFFIHFLLGTYLFLTIQLTEVACILRRTFFHCQSYEVFFSMRMWRSIHTWMRRGNCTHGDGVHWILFSLLRKLYPTPGAPHQWCAMPITLSRSHGSYSLCSHLKLYHICCAPGVGHNFSCYFYQYYPSTYYDCRDLDLHVDSWRDQRSKIESWFE